MLASTMKTEWTPELISSNRAQLMLFQQVAEVPRLVRQRPRQSQPYEPPQLQLRL